MQQPEPLLTGREVAELLKVSPRKVSRIAGLDVVRLGPRTYRYRLSQVYQVMGVASPSDTP